MKKLNTIFAAVFFLIQIVHCTLNIDNCNAGSRLTDPTEQLLIVLQPENIYFAGTYNGGVYRSGNNGTNWESVNNGLFSRDFISLG